MEVSAFSECFLLDSLFFFHYQLIKLLLMFLCFSNLHLAKSNALYLQSYRIRLKQGAGVPSRFHFQGAKKCNAAAKLVSNRLYRGMSHVKEPDL